MAHQPVDGRHEAKKIVSDAEDPGFDLHLLALLRGPGDWPGCSSSYARGQVVGRAARPARLEFLAPTGVLTGVDEAVRRIAVGAVVLRQRHLGVVQVEGRGLGADPRAAR